MGSPVRRGWFRGLAGCSAVALALAATSLPASAETLQEALRAAYDGNPTLTAQRALTRAADENLPIARAGGLPTIEGSATYEENILRGEPTPGGLLSNPKRQVVGQVSGKWPLITFGAVGSAVRAADARTASSRAGLRSTEADLFTAVVGAYMDVLRDEAIVRLNEGNVSILKYTLSESRDRYRAGDRPSSDVDQAEGRAALSLSQLETARSKLIGSRESYIRLVGRTPDALTPPPPLPALPATPDIAVATALENNPKILGARAERVASDFDVTVAGAEGLPRVNAIGNVNQYDYLNSLVSGTGPRNRDQGTTASVGVQLTVPFYNGGKIAAQRRQAHEKQGVAIERVTEAERQAVADARYSFATWRASDAVMGLAKNGVAANRRALESIRAQTNAGLRPLIDRLNAEQELLNAQVTEVTAQRDTYVAGFALLASMGQAEAKSLSLDGGALYDPMTHYDAVRHANGPFFGTGNTPQPVAKGTQDTPAQNSAVTAPTRP